MADAQHVEWLLQGAEAWNRRRESAPFKPFLMNADIYGEFNKRGLLDQNGRVRLNRFNLSDANLIGAILRNTDFYEADLRRAKLTANLDTVDFCQADLTDSEIMLTYAGNASFGSATLHNANLIQTNIQSNLHRHR
ncbi:MAG: pentapeptide repeat-containing protein [Chloroflexi bacterium]|nr:pentapeptide repeat-containing protein [Chloroflexota bacterium]